MPPVVQPPNSYLFNLLQNLQRQVTKLGQQGTFAVGGIDVGASPSVIMGNNPDDPNIPTTVYPNITTYDENGAVRVVMGKLNATDYGIGVSDGISSLQEIWPISSAATPGPITQTSGSPGALAGSPSLASVYLGSSGDAMVTISANITLPVVTAGSAQATIFLTIDGTYTVDIVAALSEDFSGSGTIAATVSATRRLRDTTGTIAPNTHHAFGMWFSGASGGPTFDAMNLIVQPL